MRVATQATMVAILDWEGSTKIPQYESKSTAVIGYSPARPGRGAKQKVGAEKRGSLTSKYAPSLHLNPTL